MAMNKDFLRPAASAFVLALLVNACTTNPRVTDTSGRKVSLDTPHVAEHHLSNGNIVVYANTPADINQLIRELQQLGVTDRQTLSPEAWSQASCVMGGNGKCSGKCGINTCLLVGPNGLGQVVAVQWKDTSGLAPLYWCQCVTFEKE